MMRHRAIAVSTFLSLLASFSLAEESLVLSPERPKVGEAFQVLLQPPPTPGAAVAAGEFTWEVVVLDEQRQDISATAAPKTKPNAAALTMPVAVPNAQYAIKLKIKSPTARQITLTAESGSTRLVATGSSVAAATPSPAGAAPGASAAAAPMESSLELRKMGERLEAAKRWAKQTATMPKSESLVLPVEFFQAKLAKRPDGKEGITEFAQRPILDAVELHRAMVTAANQLPAESDADLFIEAWHDQRQEFLKSLPERNAATPLIVELWTEFAETWEQEVLKENKPRFREALLQAPLIVLGLLLEFDEKHIQDAMTAGPPAGNRSGGASSYGGGVYTHAAVHHARAMSRIHYRNQRRMARIGF